METLPGSDVQPHIVRDAIKHRWPLIVATFLVLTAGATLYAQAKAPEYTATAEILLKPTVGNALSPDSAKSSQQVTIAMQTEAGLVSSPQVSQLVSQALKATVAAGSTSVAATVPSNTQLVDVTYTAGTAASAQTRAEAYAAGILASREALTKATVARQVDLLTTQQTAAATSLTKATADAAVDKPTPDAVSRVQLYTNRLAAIQQSIGDLQTTTTDPGSVVTPAVLPVSPSGINPLLYILVGAFLGLGGGLLLALWRERSDDRIRARSASAIMGVPVLGSLPDHTDSDVTQEVYRHVRSGLLAACGDGAVIGVTPVAAHLRDQDLITVATRTAQTVFASGRRVAVVDATCGNVDLAAHLGLPSAGGLSDLLLDSTIPLDRLTVDADGLTVLTGGSRSAGAREALASPRFAEIVTTLRATHDYVFLATADIALSQGSDANAVVDAVVLVVRERRSTEAALEEALVRSHSLGTTVVGLLGVPRRSPKGGSDKAGSDKAGSDTAGSDTASSDTAGSDTASSDTAISPRAGSSSDDSHEVASSEAAAPDPADPTDVTEAGTRRSRREAVAVAARQSEISD